MIAFIALIQPDNLMSLMLPSPLFILQLNISIHHHGNLRSIFQAVPAVLHGMSTVFPDGVGETILMEMLDQFMDTNLICQAVNKKDNKNKNKENDGAERVVVELFTVVNGT